MISPDDDPLLSVAEIAAVMRVSKMTVYRLIHAREFTAIKIGRTFRVRESVVRNYLVNSVVTE